MIYVTGRQLYYESNRVIIQAELGQTTMWWRELKIFVSGKSSLGPKSVPPLALDNRTVHVKVLWELYIPRVYIRLGH